MCGFSMTNVTTNVREDHKLMCTLIFGIDWILAPYTISPCSVHQSLIDGNYYHSRSIEGNDADTQSAKSTKMVRIHYQS
jgi:hypothetical protein